ncbi:hypothetical protein HC175_17675, partial [Salinimicrobium sp. CDJ15-91]|nr:hypothetical protein [Salinimicrobium oceani]
IRSLRRNRIFIRTFAGYRSCFREVLPYYDFTFHNAPHKQYIFLPDGEIEIETSPGDKRNFGVGEILLMEDTEGKGHKTVT